MKVKLNKDWKQESGKYQCPHCDKEYSKMGICSHIWRTHLNPEFEPYKIAKENGYVAISWNKGLTKETDERVKQNSDALKKSIRENGHNWKGKHHNSDTKKKISEKMKIAHEEGRAWNIGKSRWNNEPSYPETFFMRVIENEFDDKEYETEYPCEIYAIDFAWPHKKKAIEIDGQQHQRYKDYQERDKRKNEALERNDWNVLRIKWKDMFNDTKHWIKIAKEFIDGNF